MPARSKPVLALLGCAMLIGCATGGTIVTDNNSQVWVDNVSVGVSGNESLLELLRRSTFVGRLAEDAPQDKRPLVVIDGVIQVDGSAALALMPAVQVSSVSTIRRVRAVAIYGAKAAGGAIVIRTRGSAGARSI